MHYLYEIILLYFALSVTALFSNNGLKHLKLQLDLNKLDLSNGKEKWIEQPLDHFDPQEERTFKIRYFENSRNWRPNGPVYVYPGGEGEEDDLLISQPDTLIYQLANETNGAMFDIEHRYYGKSLPNIPNDDKIKYFKYLSSQQALADIANFIKMLKSDPKFVNSPVVVIGGSYSGNLAAWMRMLYPDVVDAAVAISAPVLAKKDFHEFFDITRNTFAKYGTKNCLNNIIKTFNRYENLLKSNAGIETLKKELNICPGNDLTVLENIQCFFEQQYVPIGAAAQHYPVDLIKDVCRDFGSNNNLKLDHNMLKHKGCLSVEDCLPKRVQANMAWTYQYCTEFGYLATTSSEKQPFVHWLPLEFWSKTCEGLVEGDIEKRIDEGVAKTNKMYGGLSPKVSKVVFSHGDMDPWHALGVQHDLGPDAPAFIVNGTTHCDLLFDFDKNNEPEELTEKRKYVKELIKKWISNV